MDVIGPGIMLLVFFWFISSVFLAASKRMAGPAQKLADAACVELNATNTSAEMALLLQKFKNDQKSLRLELKEINRAMREIRSAYTDRVRRIQPALQGFGWIGRFDRAAKTDLRHSKRVALANALAPASKLKSETENKIRAMDLVILEAEKKLLSLKAAGQ